MEYIVAFSSFYKAIYAQEKLQERRIRSTLKKLPPEVIQSCGYALYLRVDSIQTVLEALDSIQVTTRGVYLIDTSQGAARYRRIA